jgi:hypothetical protein
MVEFPTVTLMNSPGSVRDQTAEPLSHFEQPWLGPERIVLDGIHRVAPVAIAVIFLRKLLMIVTCAVAEPCLVCTSTLETATSAT